MTKPVTRKMAVDCLLYMASQGHMESHTDYEIGGGGPFRSYYYFKCYICKKPITLGQVMQFDHIHADVHDGPHEFKNLRPVHYDPCHKKKTAKDIAANAKVKRLQNPKPSSRPMRSVDRPIPSRPFQKRPEGVKPNWGRR